MSLSPLVPRNIPDNATVQSVVDDLSHAGQIHFTSTRTGKFVPATLKVKNLNGQNGTISLRVRPDMAQNNADRLVIDGGRATGKTILNFGERRQQCVGAGDQR